MIAVARTAKSAAPASGTSGPTLNTSAGFLARYTVWVLVVAGTIGTACALALTLDRIALLADPGYIPSCSISPLLSCGSVMTSPQSQVLGFPNPLIGMMTFPILATLGVAMLGGAVLPRWMWLGMQAGVTAGAMFVHWLIWQSLYVIGALCPYCMIVWVVTIITFLYVTLHNLNRQAIPLPQIVREVSTRWASWHGLILTVWLLTIAALIAVRFWSYWAQVVL